MMRASATEDKEDCPMPTTYVRNFSYKDSLSDSEALAELRFLLDEVVPAIAKVNGVRGIKVFSGAGALRAQLTATVDMDDAGVYERLITDANVRRLLGRTYGAWDLKNSSQAFYREVTPQLIQALSSTG
jgi:hypothetical protein